MLYTDNIGLKKPAYSDPADIADINENSDIIDREFGNRYLKSETYSVEQANNAIAQAIEALPNGLVYRGAVNYYKDLPTANNELGDTYSVKYQGETGTTADGNEYAWGEYDGTFQWIKLGVNAYTKDEIDEQCSSIKSDISLLEENKLNLNFGYVYSGYGGNTGWKRLAHCEFTPTSTGIIRDTTLYIEKMPGTERGWSESSECEGILKFRVLGNKNSNGTYSMGNLFINALLNKELPSDEIALIGKVEGSVLIAEIWCKITALYSGYRAAIISNTNRTNGVNPNTQTHWILDSSGSNVSAVDSYPAWTYTTTKIIDYYGDIIKDLSDRITALENK